MPVHTELEAVSVEWIEKKHGQVAHAHRAKGSLGGKKYRQVPVLTEPKAISVEPPSVMDRLRQAQTRVIWEFGSVFISRRLSPEEAALNKGVCAF